jgi:ribosomal protein S8
MWNKMGTHQQKQQQKILEQLEVEQYIAQWSVGHRTNKEEHKKFLKFNENENKTLSKPMEYSKVSPKRKVYSHECIY